MKIFSEPKVYLIAEPKINWNGVRTFFEDMDFYGSRNWEQAWTNKGMPANHGQDFDADLLPEFCGRMCYCSFGEKQGRKENAAYLENIISQGHGSVLEHANFTFLVTQCSRGFTHEMVRHRAGFAYSQESTHYIDYSDPNNLRLYIDERAADIRFLADSIQSLEKEVVKQYGLVFETAKAEGHSKKECCSIARNLLPIGIEAKLAFTGNVRALRHFITMRGTLHNVAEIRNIAIKVYDILKDRCPNSMYGIKKQFTVNVKQKETIELLQKGKTTLTNEPQYYIEATTDRMAKI